LGATPSSGSCDALTTQPSNLIQQLCTALCSSSTATLSYSGSAACVVVMQPGKIDLLLLCYLPIQELRILC